MGKNVSFVLGQIKKSIFMDIRFCLYSGWSNQEKIKYIYEKYRIKFRHFFVPFELGQDHARLPRYNLYYDSKYGLSGHQSVTLNDLQLIKRARLNDLKTVIDVGANVGFFSLGLADMYPECSVHCLEPISQIFRCLELNTSRKTNIHAYKSAISDHKGVAKMKFDPTDTVFSKIESTTKEGINVSTQTLDDFTLNNNINSIDLLAIDTETFESHVLKGAKHTLSITKYLMIEVTIQNNKNYTFSSLLRLLSGDKYDYQLLDYNEYPRNKENKITYFDLILENKHKTSIKS